MTAGAARPGFVASAGSGVTVEASAFVSEPSGAGLGGAGTTGVPMVVIAGGVVAIP
jgi:hypothetical protein